MTGTFWITFAQTSSALRIYSCIIILVNACKVVLNAFYIFVVACLTAGNYSDYEKARSDKNLSNARAQDLINKERKHIEETIQRLQVDSYFFVLELPTSVL